MLTGVLIVPEVEGFNHLIKKMSRRKQANPKSLKAVGESDVPKARKQYDLLADTEQDLDYDDEFRPLVIDTAEPTQSPSESADSIPSSALPSGDTSPVQTQPEYISLPMVEDLPYSNDLIPRGGVPYSHDIQSGSEKSLGSWSESDISSHNNMTLLANRQRQSAPSKTRRKSDKILPVSSGSGENYVCPICKETLPNNHELTKHIRSHNTTSTTNSNSCTICGKVLSSQSSLDRHMLVHSGERPFKCKICHMSFTTNGNMHRHSRIHEKELGVPQDSLLQEVGLGLPNPRRARHKNSNESDDSPPTVSKRSMNGDDSSMVVKRKRDEDSHLYPAAKRFLGGAGIGNHSDDYGPLPLNSPYKRMVDSSANTELGNIVEDGEKPFTCPACTKAFLCSYGLETHLDSHANFSTSTRCIPCEQNFRSPKAFQMHALFVHLRHKSTKDMMEGIDLKVNGIRSNVPVGFHDLEFMDFSSANFPLVAKAWCEKNQRRASSTFHDFTCKRCNHAFPCLSALTMHMDTHAPEFLATCTKCDCTFSSREEFENHIIGHNTEKVVSNYTKKDGTDDNLIQDSMSKEEFLLVLNLQVDKEKSGKAERKQFSQPFNHAIKREDMRVNVDYFNKLDQMKPTFPVAPYSNNDNDDGNDFADIDRIVENTSSMTMEGLAQQFASIPQQGAADMGRVMPKLQRMPASAGYSSTGSLGSPSSQPLPPLKPLGVNRNAVKTEMLVIDEDNNSIREEKAKTKDLKTAEKEDGHFQCKYCDEMFTNYRSHKSHVRAHLGLSPYKCNLCSYSSADKSTLIRHLRTHNGERPFQCRICEFAFTTKANCERHVRKKHGCDSKEDIESAIGYNQYLNEGNVDNDAFASPDTVCKYCGEDFKFFRALKHHLRSHSSCRNKPFMCKICNNGFSTKANCVRHIQKQHTEIEQNQLEKNITVSEFFVEGQEVSNSSSPSPVESSVSKMEMSQDSPSRHSAGLRCPTSLPRSVATISPAHQHSPIHPAFPKAALRTYITTPPITPLNTQEPQEVSSDQPLDFSMKGSRSCQSSPSPVRPQTSLIKDENQDQPMDLSKKPFSMGKATPNGGCSLPGIRVDLPSTRTQAMSPSVSSAEGFMPMKLPVIVQPPSALLSHPDYGMLRYKKEYQKFYNPMVGRLQCPYCKMLFKHGLKLLVHIRSHTNERPFRCVFCSAGFTIKTNLDRHYKTRHPQMAEAIERAERADAMGEHISDSDDSFMYEANNNVSKVREPRTLPDPKSPYATYGSDSELASVNRILDATDATQFQGFFHHSSPSEDATAILRAAASYRASAEASRSEMASLSGSLCLDADQVSVVSEKSGDVKSEPSSLNISPHKSVDGDHLSPRKKRNSYADSPHKLQCPYCPRAFPWISSLKRHILTHTGQKPFKCPQCPTTFSTKSNRERHMIRKHGLNVHDPATRQMMDRPYKCHLCVFSSFASGGNLLRHYREKHPDKDVPESLVQNLSYNNLSAEEAMLSLDKLTGFHSENHSSGSEHSGAPNSMADFEGEDDEDADMDDEVDDFKFEDGLGRKLFEHSASASAPPSRSDTPDLSQPGTTDKYGAHINPERDNYNVDKITECWKCNLSFDSRKGLLRHLKEHNIDLPFKCYLCDASFEDRRECLLHKMNFHVSDWDTMKDKNKVANLDEFVSNMDIIVEETLSGNISSKVVDQLDDLKPESDYAQRKVYCSLCPKRFWSLQDLRRHMRSHTGERPFECDVCQARFTLKHSMMRHRRKHTDPGEAVSSSDDEYTGADNSVQDSMNASMDIHKNASSPAPGGSHSLPRKVKTPQRLDVRRQDRQLDDSDMLKNLLGVGDDDLNLMLNSAQDAAKLLGM